MKRNILEFIAALIAGSILMVPAKASTVITDVGGGYTTYALLSGDSHNNYDGSPNTRTGPSVFQGRGYAEAFPGADPNWLIGAYDYLTVYGPVIYGQIRFSADDPAPADQRVFLNNHFLVADPNDPNLYNVAADEILTDGMANFVAGFSRIGNNGWSFDVLTGPVSQTPEPTTALLFAGGLALLLIDARRKVAR